jgi:hypothetical protein
VSDDAGLEKIAAGFPSLISRLSSATEDTEPSWPSSP